MAFQIDSQKVISSAPPSIKKTVKILLDNMKVKKKRDCYSSYAPHLDFNSPLSRGVVGAALGFIWEYCAENDLPWFNMLVETKKDQTPGEGIMKWYAKKFGTLKDYDVYCATHAQLAELLLNNGSIVII